jgi:hypothetical protein
LLLKSGQGWKREEKLAAFSFFALNPDASAVSENNFSCDAKSQAGPVVTAFRNTEEFVENSTP